MGHMADAPAPAAPARCATAVAALSKLVTLWKPTTHSHPPISSIPNTSNDRLAQAATADEKNDGTDQPASNTVLYLAYGSNLCAETFLGVRGIRPLSQVNVSVPALRLTFDLPGMPYGEPCFANVDWRKLPKDPKLPPVPKLPPTPPLDPPHPPFTESTWGGELIGVVYEVTREDYSQIIRTEGGGASYKEIVVPCLPIPDKIGVPEKPPLPELPRPFFARTLFAPYIPEEVPDDPRKDKWWYKFILPPHRPSQNYAQASARYLKLIKDGATEHDLPNEYQRYLNHLQPYTITTWRQSIGNFLFKALLFPLFMAFVMFSRLFADKNGTLPPWLMVASTVMFNVSWRFYDFALKPLFGDGERTEDKKGHSAFRREWRKLPCVCDEEKAALLVKVHEH